MFFFDCFLIVRVCIAIVVATGHTIGELRTMEGYQLIDSLEEFTDFGKGGGNQLTIPTLLHHIFLAHLQDTPCSRLVPGLT